MRPQGGGCEGALAAFASLFALVLAGDTVAGGFEPLYATISTGTKSELVRVDPATLHVIGPRLALSFYDRPWVRSPDGSQLAVGSGRVSGIRVVDLRAWSVMRNVRLQERVLAIAWPRRDRLLTIVAGSRCCPQALRALVLDPATGRAERSVVVGRGTLVDAARTPDGLALLLAPHARIGALRLLAIDSAARVRSVRVEAVEAGWRTSRSQPRLSHYRTPGLAVDPAGRRALVVGGATLAIVDLRNLRVRAAPIRVRTLADGGFSSGTYRRAFWLAGDRVAITGWSDRVTGMGAQRRQATTPAGLMLANARTLTVRRLDARARTVTRAGDLLLATGAVGITAYGLDGRRRYRALEDLWLAELPTAGGFAYVGASDSYKRHRVQVVDVDSGRPVREVWVKGLLTPLTAATPRICWC
jgi:hypothetical protein